MVTKVRVKSGKYLAILQHAPVHPWVSPLVCVDPRMLGLWRVESVLMVLGDCYAKFLQSAQGVPQQQPGQNPHGQANQPVQDLPRFGARKPGS